MFHLRPSSHAPILNAILALAVAAGCSSDGGSSKGSGAATGGDGAQGGAPNGDAGAATGGSARGGSGGAARGGEPGSGGTQGSAGGSGEAEGGGAGVGVGVGGSSSQAGAPGTQAGAAGSTLSAGGAPALGGGLNYAGVANAPVVIDGQVYCGTAVCLCNDGLDNDGDGVADGFDPECTGAYDNDEGSYATGIPGDNSDEKWQDCFFDGNSGAGDDGCRYSTDCMTGDLPMSDSACTLAESCISFCSARTPPGCDCFGCCEITDAEGQARTVRIGGTCDYENLDACATCVQTTECVNECGECELCAGKTVEALPASCFETGSGGASGAGGTAGTAGGTAGTSSGGSSAGGSSAGGASSGGSGATPPPNVCDGDMVSCSVDWPCYSGGFCLQGCCYQVY